MRDNNYALDGLVGRTLHGRAVGVIGTGKIGALVLDLTGPTTGRAGVRVEEQDGRAVGVPLFTGGAEDHGDAVTTSLTMSTQVATRLAGGRRSPQEAHVVIHGDDDVAQRVLAALTITP